MALPPRSQPRTGSCPAHLTRSDFLWQHSSDLRLELHHTAIGFQKLKCSHVWLQLPQILPSRGYNEENAKTLLELAVNLSRSLRLEVAWAGGQHCFPEKVSQMDFPSAFYHVSAQCIELHILRFVKELPFHQYSHIFLFLVFFSWMTGFQMSEGSSSSLKIRLIFKLCFQRKRRNLEITDYIKQITHIAGVNSIQGGFNFPGVFISLNIISISNENLMGQLNPHFI